MTKKLLKEVEEATRPILERIYELERKFEESGEEGTIEYRHPLIPLTPLQKEYFKLRAEHLELVQKIVTDHYKKTDDIEGINIPIGDGYFIAVDPLEKPGEGILGAPFSIRKEDPEAPAGSWWVASFWDAKKLLWHFAVRLERAADYALPSIGQPVALQDNSMLVVTQIDDSDPTVDIYSEQDAADFGRWEAEMDRITLENSTLQDALDLEREGVRTFTDEELDMLAEDAQLRREETIEDRGEEIATFLPERYDDFLDLLEDYEDGKISYAEFNKETLKILEPVRKQWCKGRRAPIASYGLLEFSDHWIEPPEEEWKITGDGIAVPKWLLPHEREHKLDFLIRKRNKGETDPKDGYITGFKHHILGGKSDLGRKRLTPDGYFLSSPEEHARQQKETLAEIEEVLNRAKNKKEGK